MHGGAKKIYTDMMPQHGGVMAAPTHAWGCKKISTDMMHHAWGCKKFFQAAPTHAWGCKKIYTDMMPHAWGCKKFPRT